MTDTPMKNGMFVDVLNVLAKHVFQRNVDAGWWHDLETGELKDRNDYELIALMHSELSEAVEGLRKDQMDDHLTHRKMVEVEMADTIIRIMDFCGARGLDIGGAVVEKIEYNRTRADHQPEARLAVGGKKA